MRDPILNTRKGRAAEQRARAGCEALRLCRASHTVIGLYRSSEAGIEDDPETPWSTLCEDHGAVVCHPSRRFAVMAMSWPDWCEECQEIIYPTENV